MRAYDGVFAANAQARYPRQPHLRSCKADSASVIRPASPGAIWLLYPALRIELRMLRNPINFDEPAQQSLHILERHHVWTIGRSAIGVLMRLYEKRGNSNRDGRPCEHRDKLSLSSRCCSLSARLLHGMGRIEYHGRSGASHQDWQGTHIGHQRIVSE